MGRVVDDGVEATIIIRADLEDVVEDVEVVTRRSIIYILLWKYRLVFED